MRVVSSGKFILGAEVEAFEREVARRIGVRHAVAVSSGTDALALALRGLGLGPGDKVAIPAFSFFATAEAVLHAGCRPVFVDVDPETQNLSVGALQKLAGRVGIRAVMPVHLFGLMADMKKIRGLARRHGWVVVEDACQAIGAARDGLRAGAAGDAAGFSFFPTKNLGGFGDGGLVTTNEDAVARRVRRLRNHGSVEKNIHTAVGVTGRLDALQACVLRVLLRRLTRWNRERRRIAARYDRAFRSLPGIVPPPRIRGATHVYHQYTIRVTDGRRDELQAFLRDQGVASEIYYPVPIPKQPALARSGFRRGPCPAAVQCSREVLSLPIFPELSGAEQDHVIRAVRSFARRETGFRTAAS